MAKKVPALKKAKIRRAPPQQTVWRGPEEDGVTQSLLGRFLVCRERFRLLVVEGLKPDIGFNSRMEYGHMFHLCCETDAMDGDWEAELKRYAAALAREYRNQSAEVEKWYQVCKIQFKLYRKWLKNHPGEHKREPLLREYSFKTYYTLPSGRRVKLMGKMDGVDVAQVGKRKMLVLDENKTKGEVDDVKITRQLSFDLQTMMYLFAMRLCAQDANNKDIPNLPIYGVSYNLIKRPLSGGVGTIRPRKATKNNPAETMRDYYDRLAGVLAENVDSYFMVKDVVVTSNEIDRYVTMFLEPTLEQLCDWWEWIVVEPDNPFREGNAVHNLFPYGVFNPMLEGNFSDVDNFLLTGATTGLKQVQTLFEEL